MADKQKKTKEPLLHIAKRDDMSDRKAWGVRLAVIAFGVILAGFCSCMLTGTSFFTVMSEMFTAVFGRLFMGKTAMLWKFLWQTAILLCVSLAVAPAFRMRFWNCGAEGQTLMGGLAAFICMNEIKDAVPYPVLLLIVIAAGVLAGAVWGVIPAVFKALYRTNETLFTLMMNYVATQIVVYYVHISSNGNSSLGRIEYGLLPVLFNKQYFLNVFVVVVLMVLSYIYLRHSKQGYEISVVGESQNTARYVGINVKKVILRTMAISGALCGIAGILLVAGADHTINAETVGGRGFTAIMIAWLGQFNPFIMAGMSALVTFLDMGVGTVADDLGLNRSYADVVTSVVILLLVGCEFFVHYSVKFRRNKKGGGAQ